jgi:hypothetical protein
MIIPQYSPPTLHFTRILEDVEIDKVTFEEKALVIFFNLRYRLEKWIQRIVVSMFVVLGVCLILFIFLIILILDILSGDSLWINQSFR